MRLNALQAARDVFGKQHLSEEQKKELGKSSMALYSKTVNYDVDAESSCSNEEESE